MYTKDDFLKAYQSGGYDLSDADMRLASSNPDVGMSMLSYLQKYQRANSDQERNDAHNQMEQLRRMYGGYSGGANGTGYELAYNEKNDPLYSAYAKQYRREGERQTRDTLASYASMTGGVPSSFAVSAAQQAGNNYSAQLADKYPELYKAFYNQAMSQITGETNETEEPKSPGGPLGGPVKENPYMNEEFKGKVLGTFGGMEIPTEEWEAIRSGEDGEYMIEAMLYYGFRPVGTQQPSGESYGTGPATTGNNDMYGVMNAYPNGIVPAGVWDRLTYAQQRELTMAGFTRGL